MLRFAFPMFLFVAACCGLHAQSNDFPQRPPTMQQLSPADAAAQSAANRSAVFASNLAMLKKAFAEKNTSQMMAYEVLLLDAMRVETDRLSEQVATEAAQAERRKLASSGQITTAPKREEAPARDLFAEAITPAEQRLEAMQYTLAAFERHSFDPGQPEAAARDFAKLDAFLKMMQE